MLRLYLRDPRTQITVEAPASKNWNFPTPVLRVTWDLKEATAILAQAIGEKENKPPMQALFESAEFPFEIIAKWRIENA